MAHISRSNRSQLLLLPEAVDDYVGPDNPVRFIEAFVDELDLAAVGLVHFSTSWWLMTRSRANLLLTLAVLFRGAGNVAQKTVLDDLGPTLTLGSEALPAC